MLLTTFGEFSNIGTNLLDHGVRLAERIKFKQKYLPNRLKKYRGQKKLAILYHGYAQGRAAFETMERVLSSPLFGFFPITSGYQPYSQDIRVSAAEEVKQLERIRRETDAEEVYLIGHSQGGLLIREIIQGIGYTEDIKHCLFLGTPHMGTWAGLAGFAHQALVSTASYFLPRVKVKGESARQMIPGCKFLRTLNAKPLPSGISYTNIYNYIDPLVWPASYARLPYQEAHNVLMMKIGHLQMLYDLQELEIILRTLMEPDITGQKFMDLVLGDSALETRGIQIENTESQFEELVAG
jgi:hypothetical protein